MAKFSGVVGYITDSETTPGIHESNITEKSCKGDFNKNYVRRDNVASINDSLNISNDVSILADAYASEHMFEMKYIRFTYPRIAGVWKINSIDASSYPRITISLGGLYNGKQA